MEDLKAGEICYCESKACHVFHVYVNRREKSKQIATPCKLHPPISHLFLTTSLIHNIHSESLSTIPIHISMNFNNHRPQLSSSRNRLRIRKRPQPTRQNGNRQAIRKTPLLKRKFRSERSGSIARRLEVLSNGHSNRFILARKVDNR